MSLPIDPRELDILLSFKWQEHVVKRLAAQGVDVWKSSKPYAVLSEAARSVFSCRIEDLVSLFLIEGVPVQVAHVNPLPKIGEGVVLSHQGGVWIFEYWERGVCCHSEMLPSKEAAIRKAVRDAFPFLA